MTPDDHEFGLRFAAEGLRRGEPTSDIMAGLLERGFDERDALRIIDETVTNYLERARIDKHNAWKRSAKVGTAFLVGGLFLTGLTLIAASPGNHFLVFTGAIFIGIFYWLKALVHLGNR